ncbi:MAG: ribbon-helix-helix protein, CopG family [Euryarchaeota archaeon]|nr:ribbon-helix-helix protein, CopG family [Euryarchaeota archaeon]
MNNDKINFGIRIDTNLAKKLDEIVKESGYLNISRSEVVEAVLTAYFKSDASHGEKARELIILKRKGKL